MRDFLVYSGPKNNVNRNKGFFVGSDTRRPCKFHREKDGSFTTEEFDRLSTAPISELYVGVTGDVTIAAKTATDLYQTYAVSNWKCNLSQLTGDVTIDQNMSLTGTTGYCIHIADGATVTLDGATVNNQIVCDGNANVILASGSTNRISCSAAYGRAAIQAGPAGTTLTISSSGTVFATGGAYGAGIGSGDRSTCGDIAITGGTVFATGGVGSAGIGSGDGYDATCGNITIKGGTVTATGGDYGAGIGSGHRSICGDITIRKTVTKVTAKRGEYAVPIGAGYNGTCGTVTIENGANVIQE